MQGLVIVPTYNEKENIESLIHQALEYLPLEWDILVVDDGSPDGTGEIVRKVTEKNSRVFLSQRSGKLGLGTAYIHGFKWGLEKKYQYFVEMDADFSHHPKYLPVLISSLQQNDFVVGSRYVLGGGTLNWGLGRRLLSKAGSFYARTILGVEIRDFTGGFNGWTRDVLYRIDLDKVKSDGYCFQIEMKYRASLQQTRWVEFPIIFEDRKVGHSKMSKAIILEALLKVLLLRQSVS